MINTAYQLWIDPLNQPAFLKAMLAGSLVATVCGVIGCFVILRRMSFLGDALAHSMLAGVVAGYLFMQIFFDVEADAPAMIVGSLIAGFVTVAMIGFVSKTARIKEDTAIGIIYTGIFALGGMLASLFSHRIHIDLVHFFMGQVLAVSTVDLWTMALVTALVLGVVIVFFRQLQMTSFDPVMAASIGIPVVAMNYLLTTCTSLVVVSAVQVVGMVLVVGLLITPAASAYLLCDQLCWMLGVSACLGVSSVVGGLYLSEWINVAPGSAIVVFGTLQFLFILAIAPRYGMLASWRRRRAIIPQQVVEDILGCLRRSKDRPVPVTEIHEEVEGRAIHIQQAVRSLMKQNLLKSSPNGLSLTESGNREARRLMRAHRIWETYLQHLGTPAEELHVQADRLEHVNDEQAVDYLDNKLGHPLLDPHGSEIPEDFVDLVSGYEVKASLLREGYQATITRLDSLVDDFALESGMQISAGPRRDNGRVWTFIVEGGREIELGHQQADAVTVILD